MDSDIPYLTWVYTDHVQKCDIVCVAISVISGCTDVNFGLSEDGTTVFVNYTWPCALFSPSLLYKAKLNNNVMTLDHPEIHSFASRLIELEWSVKSKPKGIMQIPLPVKVQRDIGTWSKEGIKCDTVTKEGVKCDSNMILLKFRAFQKKLVIEDADTSITFA